jgi:hypothetical protein
MQFMQFMDSMADLATSYSSFSDCTVSAVCDLSPIQLPILVLFLFMTFAFTVGRPARGADCLRWHDDQSIVHAWMHEWSVLSIMAVRVQVSGVS